MKNLFGEHVLRKKVIAYLPTYRTWKQDLKVNGNRNWDNLFGFESFDLEQFADFLRDNHLFLICKLHHMEYNQLNFVEYSNYSEVIRFIQEVDLIEHDIDLYEILANVEMLLTDYSSVYFDLLLTGIPLIFVPVDLQDYIKNRGFNMEPYDFWAPGPKVFSQRQLQETILSLFETDAYASTRNQLCNIVHAYKDDQAHARVWNLVDQLLDK